MNQHNQFNAVSPSELYKITSTVSATSLKAQVRELRCVIVTRCLLRTAVLVVLSCFISGCGTLWRSSGKGFDKSQHLRQFYPACRVDTWWYHWGGFGYLDLPLSFVTDTLLLPWDLATKQTPEEAKRAEFLAMERGSRPEIKAWLTKNQQLILRGASSGDFDQFNAEGDRFFDAVNFMKWAITPPTSPYSKFFGWPCNLRFATHQEQMAFIEQLYEAGAKRVFIRHAMRSPLIIIHLSETGQEAVLTILAKEEAAHRMLKESTPDGQIICLWWISVDPRSYLP